MKIWWKDKFNIFMVTIAYLTFLFIVTAIVTVMIKGIPHITKSLATPEIQFAIKLSLYTSLISTAFCIVIAIPVAYVLARVNFPLKSFLIRC